MKNTNENSRLLSRSYDNNVDPLMRIKVFSLTFISYASSHMARKSYSNVKSYLQIQGLSAR